MAKMSEREKKLRATARRWGQQAGYYIRLMAKLDDDDSRAAAAGLAWDAALKAGRWGRYAIEARDGAR